MIKKVTGSWKAAVPKHTRAHVKMFKDFSMRLF